ncbi:MAG: hypothetical protein QMD95_03965 [Candidatus Hodarchaeaceae archaeon]|nr:hypothetical protein [Candidatus Hodarchaeaceae archaeon]
MEQRTIIKSLRDFAASELKEKRADRVLVGRVRLKQWLRRGRVPDFRVRTVEGTHYLVCVFRGDELRLYYMDKRGLSLGASDFSGVEKEKVWTEVSKGTKIIFRLPS